MHLKRKISGELRILFFVIWIFVGENHCRLHIVRRKRRHRRLRSKNTQASTPRPISKWQKNAFSLLRCQNTTAKMKYLSVAVRFHHPFRSNDCCPNRFLSRVDLIIHGVKFVRYPFGGRLPEPLTENVSQQPFSDLPTMNLNTDHVLHLPRRTKSGDVLTNVETTRRNWRSSRALISF